MKYNIGDFFPVLLTQPSSLLPVKLSEFSNFPTSRMVEFDKLRSQRYTVETSIGGKRGRLGRIKVYRLWLKTYHLRIVESKTCKQ